MLKTRVMPCLLLRRQALVKTVRFRNARYVGDPINTVRIFNEMEVDELVFLDITASVDNKPPQFDLVEELATECFMPFAYGGGVKSIDSAHRLFSLGVEKIVINSVVHENPQLVTDLAHRFGCQSIVASIDAKRNLFGKYAVCTHNGTRNTKRSPAEFAREAEQLGAGEILITSIDRDGMFNGYDIALVKQVSDAVTIPVIACGGASSVDDFTVAVKEGGAAAIAAGSMFVYQGTHRAVLVNFPTKERLREAVD